MKKYLTLFLMLFLLVSHTRLSAMTTTDSSTIRGPSAPNTKVQCTNFILNGKNIGYAADPTSQAMYNAYTAIGNAWAAMGPPYDSLAYLWYDVANSFVMLPTVFDTADCISVNSTNTGMAAANAVVGFVGGGDLGIMCPASHPFYTSYNETWVFVFSNGGVNPSARCCKVPPNKVANSTNWATATPDTVFGGQGICNQTTN